MDRAPRLETGRLILRSHRREDLDDYAAMWGNADVVRHITGTPASRADSWHRLVRALGMWLCVGYGYWAVDDKDTGRFVGALGFAAHMRDIGPRFDTVPESGWTLAPWAQGRGFASEALAAALAWADRQPGFERTVCMITPDNGPSVRLAEKTGYQPYGETDYAGSRVILFERERST